MRERCTQVGLAILALVLGTCMACAHHRAAPLPPVRTGIVSGPALMLLAAEWDTAQFANERGYCVVSAAHGRWNDSTRADSVWVVSGAEPARTLEAAPDHTLFFCGPGIPTIHTHPWMGHPPNCDASKPDYAVLRRLKAPFAVIQCGPVYFKFYYPNDR